MKQETLEDAAENHYEEQSKEFENNTDNPIFNTSRYLVAGFIEGAKCQSKRMYSEEDMRKAYDQGIDDSFDIGFSSKDDANFNKWFEQFKKKEL